MGRIALASSNQLSRAGEVALNVLLLVPLGVAIGLLPRRRTTLAVVAGAALLPFAIEIVQLVVVRLGRECQAGDMIDNLTGLALGALVTATVRWVLRARANRAIARRDAPAATAAALAAGIILAMLLIPSSAAAPVPLPTPRPTPTPTVAGESVLVGSIPALLEALADDDVGEIVVANGTYPVSTAGTQAVDSLWIGSRFARRTNPVIIRAETTGGVIIDGGGAAYFGGVSFQQGAHDQTWDGFVFANGTPTETGVITFGGYAGEPSAHHITMRNIRIDDSVTSDSTGATDHGVYVAHGLGGPHDLLFEDFSVDGRGGLTSAFHFYGSEDGNPNAWNVTIRRLSVAGTQQAVMLWDRTLHDITIDTATITDARDFAIRYESRGATNIVLANITSRGSGSGKGFQSSLGNEPEGVTFINDSLH